MSRYYSIEITPGQNSALSAPVQYTSFPNGQNDPGALNVEFDFFSFQSPESQGSQGFSTLTIHGVPLSDLFQANQFAGSYITVKAGMQAGLPLANPSQAGTILRGEIYQSFGNWVGEDMTLDFVMNSASYTYSKPGNIVLNWPKGTSLSAALTTCLNVAFPASAGVTMNIGNYVLSYDVLHAVNSLSQLSKFIYSITSKLSGAQGVSIAMQPDNTILCFDGTTTPTPKQLVFTDLIGQPTWIGQNLMQVQTVMRGDIQVGSYIKMPLGLPNVPGGDSTTGGALPSSLKYQTSFRGTFNVVSARFVGNFRDPQGTSWVSIFKCYTVPGTSTTVGPQP